MMDAVYFEHHGGPEVLRYGPRPTPRPAPDQILIEVHAVGVNPRDWMLRQGTYVGRPLVGRLPIIPGSDVSGVVADVGEKVQGFAIGDEVFAMQSQLGNMGATPSTSRSRPPAWRSSPRRSAMSPPPRYPWQG